MDYLRTLGSAAVSTLVQKSGFNLPFSLGSKLAQVEGYYNIFDATKRDDNSLVSVFEYDLSDSSKKNLQKFALNALRKLRTTRHPDILKFMDAVESDTCIYIMTERVRPLSAVLPQYSAKTAQEREDWLLWGLHRIAVALTFLNDQCLSTHGKVSPNAIFITPSGEWRLGGFEVFSSPKDSDALLYTMSDLLPGSSFWAPPEVKKNGWSALKDSDPAAADAYAFGLLLHAVFNPSHPLPPTADPTHPPPAPSSRGCIPQEVFPLFKKLLNPNPKMRLNAKGFLEIGMVEETGFFARNRLVKVCSGLDNLALANETEKSALLRTLKESASSFPPEFASHRILPALLSALEFGGASAVAILPLVLQFGSNIAPDEYPKVILTPIIKLYASPDRGTRMALLDHLPEYLEKLDRKTVSEKIFPHLQLGFSDTVAVIREATVKSISLLAPKLTDRIINNDLLRLLAKTQMDSEPSIRTNTCILIGRLGPTLGHNTKRKVLVPAFSRALRDPFVHARVAGLMALMATIDCFEVSELASKVIPSMAFTLVDEEKLVRDQAFKALELFVKRLEEHVSQMPETAATDGVNNANEMAPVPTTLVTSAAGAAGSLAGWALSSLGRKLAASDMRTPITSAAGSNFVFPASTPNILSNSTAESAQPSLALQAQLSQNVRNSQMTSTTKAMQLGADRVLRDLAFGTPAEDASNFSAADGNSWGADLIDVNADLDDWSAFEPAPTPALQTQIISSGVNPYWESDSAGSAQLPSSLGVLNGIRPSPPVDREESLAIQHARLPLSRPASRAKSPPQDATWNAVGMWGPINDNSTTANSPSLASSQPLSKEGKLLEMARRKEERKQRIAMLKEQKKTVSKPV